MKVVLDNLTRDANGHMEVACSQRTVFSSPWFDLIARTRPDVDRPYYVIMAPDCVNVIALTNDNNLLLVKQHRITIQEDTIEFPSGHIDHGEKPEDAAFRELFEETGYQAASLELLGIIATDTGRLGNKLWCYFATGLTFVHDTVDVEIQNVLQCPPSTLMQYIHEGKIVHAQDIASTLLAIQKGKLLVN